MNKSRRHKAKRNRQIKKWTRQYKQLYWLWWNDYEVFRSSNQYRRWFLMDVLGL